MDGNGKMVRRFSSADPVPPPRSRAGDSGVLAAAAGGRCRRPPASIAFVWDMHYPPVPGVKPEYPISAVEENTAPAPTSPWIMPGKYTVVLTVDGKKYTQPLTVEMDPRVKTSTADLAEAVRSLEPDVRRLLALQSVVETGSRGSHATEGDAREGERERDAAKLDATDQRT